LRTYGIETLRKANECNRLITTVTSEMPVIPTQFQERGIGSFESYLCRDRQEAQTVASANGEINSKGGQIAERADRDSHSSCPNLLQWLTSGWLADRAQALIATGATLLGLMFWFMQKKFVGSYLAFNAAKRSYFFPYAARMPSSSTSPR
jgi:hypothetical protein